MLFVLLIVTGCQRVAPLLEPSAARQTWGMQNPEQVYRQIFTNRSVEILHPVRLKIPVLGVDAAIEAVGRDAEGAMATPSDICDAAKKRRLLHRPVAWALQGKHGWQLK
jgi:hypothetical protein